MSTLTVEIPDSLAADLEAVVEAGWFSSQDEVVRAAVRDFVDQQKLALAERQQLADVAWAEKLARKQP